MEKKSIVILILAIIVLGGIILGGAVIFKKKCSIVIKPGERGVIFYPFSTGLDKENIYQEGLHIIYPWNHMIIYNIKEQSVMFNDKADSFGILDILDKNGLLIKVYVTIKFYPEYENIGYLHEQFGGSYINTLVVPEVRSSIRKIMGHYNAEEIYSTEKQEIEEEINTTLFDVLKTNNIYLTSFKIDFIKLPSQLEQVIDER